MEDEELLGIEEVETPNKRTIDEVAEYLNVSPKKLIKSVVYKDTEKKRLLLPV